MYIGPWQEYKLARLIQHQHQVLARELSAQDVRRGRPFDASPASSRSGFSGQSTQSAPAHVPGPSAQVRLNDYCDSIERAERRRGAPRPRAPSGGSSNASTRPYSSSSGSTRGQGGSSSSTSSGRAAAKRAAGPKKSGKPPKAVSLEEPVTETFFGKRGGGIAAMPVESY
ncbi:Glutaredoxin-C6 [Durusdinium trenchii]|uniref:Glutaredoxin-C6 n=1 Tax=Durusdinium trenchii TaxID=1381693 RepID=A0ABP0NMD7_9DINO